MIYLQTVFQGMDHHWKDNSFATCGEVVEIWDEGRSEPVRYMGSACVSAHQISTCLVLKSVVLGWMIFFLVTKYSINVTFSIVFPWHKVKRKLSGKKWNVDRSRQSVITSRINGRSNIIGPVCVCVCVCYVCLFVFQHSHGWTFWCTDAKTSNINPSWQKGFRPKGLLITGLWEMCQC